MDSNHELPFRFGLLLRVFSSLLCFCDSAAWPPQYH